MKNCYFFHRSDQHCLLAQNICNDEWMGFVGFDDKHPFYGCGFKKVKHIGISKMPINDKIIAQSWKDLWYMGFCTHPYSRDKTLEDLLIVVDGIKEELRGN